MTSWLGTAEDPGHQQQSPQVMHSLSVPDALFDETNKHQPFASDAVRAGLVEQAAREHYDNSDFRQMTDQNAELARQLFVAPAGYEESEHAVKRLTCVELILCILSRVRNQHVLPFMLICLSVLAYNHGLADNMWQVLGSMFVLFDKAWSEGFIADVATFVAIDPPGTNTNVRFVVFDNVSYTIKTTYQHAERGLGGLLHSVNWLSVPFDQTAYMTDVKRGEWRSGGNRYDVRRKFAPASPEIAAFLVTTWCAFMAQACQGYDILAHPAGPKPTRTHHILHEPVLDAGTASYSDVTRVLAAIKQHFVYPLAAAVPAVKRAKRKASSGARATARAAMVMCVGYWQSYSRVVHLKCEFPARYNWIIPLPGDLHFTMHIVDAMHCLWWASLVCTTAENSYI